MRPTSERHPIHFRSRPFRSRLQGLASALLLAASCVLAAAAQAGPPHRGGPMSPGRFLERHAETLGLDAGTQEKILEISKASREQNDALRAQLDQAHESMRALLSAEPVDEEAVIEQARRLGDLESEKRIHRLRAMLEIQALLTPEQRAKLAELREAHAEMRKSHGEWKRGMRGACREDRQRLCPDARRGPAGRQCLMDHVDDLSPECRAAVESAPPPPPGPPGPPPEDAPF